MGRGLPPQGVFYLEHNIISSEHGDDDHMNDDHGDLDKDMWDNVPPEMEKRADGADAFVLFFSCAVLIF